MLRGVFLDLTRQRLADRCCAGRGLMIGFDTEAVLLQAVLQSPMWKFEDLSCIPVLFRRAIRERLLSRLLKVNYKLFLYAVLYCQFQIHCQQGSQFECRSMVE